MLEEFGPQIWVADGPTVTGAAGFDYPTRMAVMRLDDASLAIWSPVALSAELRAAVDQLGRVAIILPPNSLHHSFLAEWQTAYPQASVLAPPGLRQKRPDIRFEGDIGDRLPHFASGQIESVVLSGNAITEEVVFFHVRSGTVLFADLIQHLPKHWYRGWRALVARLDLMSGAEAAVPRKFRLAFRDRHATREAVRRILDWQVRAVLIAHGAPVTIDAPGFLRRAFAWLTDKKGA